MQNKDDGTHAIFPVATRAKGAMDHAGMPVMLLRHSDGKMRHDGFRTAWTQHDFAVDERGRLHGAPALVDVVVSRGQACISGPCRNRGDHRQWAKKCKTPGRLRRQDKASCLASGTSFLSFCLHIVFARLGLDVGEVRRRRFGCGLLCFQRSRAPSPAMCGEERPHRAR